MSRIEARFAVTVLMSVGFGGLGAILVGDSLDDRLAGAGFACLCLGLFLQHHRYLARRLGDDGRDGAAAEPGPFRGLPMALQLVGALLFYAGIAEWIAGRA